MAYRLRARTMGSVGVRIGECRELCATTAKDLISHRRHPSRECSCQLLKSIGGRDPRSRSTLRRLDPPGAYRQNVIADAGHTEQWSTSTR